MAATFSIGSFRSDLAADLAASLSVVCDAAGLEAVVSDCAAAAEGACGERDMACRAGCPHCCLLNVAVLLPEAMVIAQQIQERLSPVDLASLQKVLRSHRCWTRWMDDEERIIKQAACPFLDVYGGCSIHPVRPLVCRGVTSLDSEGCQRAFAPVVTDEAEPVLTDLLRKAVFDETFRALGDALRQSGFDHRSIELGTGVLAFLEDPRHRDRLLSRLRLPDELWL